MCSIVVESNFMEQKKFWKFVLIRFEKKIHFAADDEQ